MEKEFANESSPGVTIAIPTYNRAKLLKQAIASALAQDYTNIRIVVLDNASSDSTELVVKSFGDARLVYMRNETNIGMLSNWNRAFQVNINPFIVFLQDDDILLPQFVSESVDLLNKYPSAGFSYALARHIDAGGVPGTLQPKPNVACNFISSLDFLHMTVKVSDYGAIYSSSVMMRATALKEVGVFDSPHAFHTFDINLYFRLAERYDVIHIPKELLYFRIHPQQESYIHYDSVTGTGLLGSNAERIDALAYLLRSERSQDVAYREWLAQRLLILNAQSSAYAHPLLPDMYWKWNERVEIAKREIESIVAAREPFILVDEAQWATGGEVAGRQAFPFTGKDGVYCGPPVDDEAAITELKQHQQQGIKYIIFGWPAFWWLEHYTNLKNYLYSSGRQIVRNSRMIGFELNQP